MKKSLSVVLLVAMLVTMFTGCSLFGDNIVGKWESEIDITQFMVDSIKKGVGEENVGLMEFFEFKDLKLKLIATFNEDGSYERSASKESVEGVMNSLIDQAIAGMKAMLMKEAEAAGATEEAVNAIIEQAKTQFGTEFSREAVDGMIEAFAVKGFYKLDDGKLYIADSVEALEGAGYETYVLEGDALTLNKGEGLEETYSEVISSLYPITYKKVAE